MAAEQKHATRANPSIILFHGDKGGVGKSFACSAFADWLVKQGKEVAVIDGDTQNPDVERMFADTIPVGKANLRDHGGWMDVVDFLYDNPTKTVLISMPAGIGGQFKQESEQFVHLVKVLDRELKMFFVINRLPDSINLLAEALDLLGENVAQTVVVRNLFFSGVEGFTRWEGSNTRKQFEAKGGKTIDLAELQSRVVDKLFRVDADVMPFSAAATPVSDVQNSPHKLTPSENFELLAWLQKNHLVFEGLNIV